MLTITSLSQFAEAIALVEYVYRILNMRLEGDETGHAIYVVEFEYKDTELGVAMPHGSSIALHQLAFIIEREYLLSKGIKPMQYTLTHDKEEPVPDVFAKFIDTLEFDDE